MEITVQSLLAYGAKCAEQAFADQLLETFRNSFFAVPAWHHLHLAVANASVDDAGAVLKLEAHHIMSEQHRTAIFLQMLGGRLDVKVETTQPLSFPKATASFVARPEDSVRAVALKAAFLAIKFQARLVHELGIPQADALEVCRKNWRGAQA